MFNLNLWRRDYHLRWFEKAMKTIGLLHFVSRIGKSETDHAILEEEFSLDTWEKTLNIFSDVDVNLIIFPFGFSINRKKTKKLGWIKPSILQQIVLGILGGGIEAVCQTTNSKKYYASSNIFDHLACPNCPNKSSLAQKEDKNLFCSTCKSSFKNRDQIYTLLTKKQENIMYS